MAKDVFRQREKGEEAKFKLDQETRFKTESRRNRMLGVWAGEKLGLPESERPAYAKTVVRSDLKEPGIDDIIGKIMEDFAKNKIDVSEAEVRAELDRLHPIALAEVQKEYPGALGTDHDKVGG